MRYLLFLFIFTAGAELKDLAADSYVTRTKAIAELIAAQESIEQTEKLILKCVEEFHKTKDIEYKLNLKLLTWELYKLCYYQLKYQEVEQTWDPDEYYYYEKTEEERKHEATMVLITDEYTDFAKKHKLNKLIKPWEKDNGEKK